VGETRVPGLPLDDGFGRLDITSEHDGQTIAYACNECVAHNSNCSDSKQLYEKTATERYESPPVLQTSGMQIVLPQVDYAE